MPPLFNLKLHKWLSLIVGIQLLIWLVTGLYFNLMDHDKSTGNVNRVKSKVQAKLSDFTLTPINELSALSVEKIKLIWIENHPYYLAITQSSPHSYQPQQTTLLDAVTGKPFSLDENLVTKIASSSYNGTFLPKQVSLLQPPISELAKQQNPVWQVQLVNPLNTNIYIDSASGKVIAHITDDRRLKDFMFMLHFMDYGSDGHFNHWQNILFALIALFLSITGALWVIRLVKQKSYVINFIHKRKRMSVYAKEDEPASKHDLTTDKTVLEGLADVGIHLPSNCRGGGTCGLCKFISTESLPISDSEKALLNSKELARGVRLGCQHLVKDVDSVSLT